MTIKQWFINYVVGIGDTVGMHIKFDRFLRLKKGEHRY